MEFKKTERYRFILSFYYVGKGSPNIIRVTQLDYTVISDTVQRTQTHNTSHIQLAHLLWLELKCSRTTVQL